MEKALTVLSISPAEEDHARLEQISGYSNWGIARARTWQEGSRILNQSPVPLILCERELPDGSWRDVVQAVARCPVAPLVIVTSRAADDALWAEVLNFGGWDVLAKPFEPAEVAWAVKTAWRECERRHAAGQPAPAQV